MGDRGVDEMLTIIRQCLLWVVHVTVGIRAGDGRRPAEPLDPTICSGRRASVPG
jgi:hypothetical protein